MTVIKPLNVIKNVGSGLFPGEIPLASDAFTFKQGEEAFHRGVIETIPFRTQRTLNPMLTQQRLKSVAGEGSMLKCMRAARLGDAVVVLALSKSEMARPRFICVRAQS